MSKTAFLKEKTDAECRQLAAHYWHRANKAEKERDSIRREVDKIRAENSRLIGLAHSMIEG
ncbi:hypothetical protein [Pseudomonas sp. 7SR1]|uniref:hypothetical protein n=1 Tax=Pseudomonas sp. 7SR1 TaxID=1881017 RepID=UPI0009537A1E|nr:hypothetical protein [Pseudomonas sp. 7SR1]ROO33428.1 hypothetical protein BIV09_23890 [Pseudomonas sp. 7SR1]SIS23076.1 hypothetical protein SAMN05428955_3407 [Pseudomonas sp. 7SR1]